ncbi:hypothetical protein ILUMI_19599 [Ignelater luminosus]|uniref:DUF5641 domain-containing protein n=1 Tax=Ignelater luminosus TaxID=2038154 RepID=A0A8K0FZR4_IGNLU|nr:hypothetical protein ILUMI_19599 [Ignelater luminosus]
MLEALVIPQITEELPSCMLDIREFQIPSNIKLADPTFYQPGQIKRNNPPLLQKTKLGWIVSGGCGVPNSEEQPKQSAFLALHELHENVERFWKADQQTTTRAEDGRFIVRIPFKVNPDKHLEARTTKQFLDFNEYIRLKHMSPSELNISKSFFLPHHCVIRESSETTKLRVVFDGSSKPDDGKAINELQHIGPNLQNEIFSIIVRFRLYEYVLIGDIEKIDDVQAYGDLSNYKCFVFENYLGKLKRLIRGKNLSLQQVNNRLHEINSVVDNLDDVEILYKPIEDLFISTTIPDNVVSVGGQICIIISIICIDTVYKCVANEFRYKEDFYVCPLKSSELGIYSAWGKGDQMYAVVEFDKKECSVVALAWLIDDQSKFLWPNIGKQDVLEEYVTSQKAPSSSWRKCSVKKVHYISDTYHEANDYLTKMVEDSCSSSDGNQLLIRRKIAEMNSQTNVQDKKEDPRKRNDEFSSDVDETEVQSMAQHNEESFDTSITYKLGTSSSLCSLKSNNTPVSSRSSNVSSSSTPAINLLLRRVERIISTQDQQNITLDNILRNLEVNNRVLERPADFPNLPNKWHREYLHTLQQNTKWKSGTYPVRVGDIVLIKEDHLPPGQWQLGRILQVHPGSDDVVRVVTVKCATGEVKRAINKVCLLPLSSDQTT